jgi:hypothetical protein
MAFKPARDTRYFLIAKNSNLPLGVRANSGATGAEIEQQGWQPSSHQPQQHFQFDAAPDGYFYLKPGHHDLYLEPQGSRHGQGREDGIPIVQETWNAGAGQQRFLLIPAGNGYYRIRCMHSAKFFDVFGNTTAVGARLTQHRFMPTDNQLFRPVAVATTGLPANTTSFQTYTNYGRMLVIGLAGVIPKVGGGIAALIGLLWPSDADQRFWQQMKDYVDVRMTEMLQHQRLMVLEDYLAGIIGNLRLANHPDVSPSDRWTHLVAITTSAKFLEGQFLNPKYEDSHRILSHLAAWGTLVLGANAQMYRNYDEMHPHLSPTECAKNKAPYKAELLHNLGKYTGAVFAARRAALKWRLEQIVNGGFATRDNLTGWMVMIAPVGKVDLSPITQAYDARVSQVTEQFNAEMDALLAPGWLWRFLDPATTARPAQDTIRRAVGPYPRLRRDVFIAEVAGTITSLSMSISDGGLLSLVAHYADGRKRVTGHEQPNMPTLNLASGEYIVSAYGIEQYTSIVGLTFETNLGQVFTTGSPKSTKHALDFSASVDDSLSARLTGFSDGDGGLYFHWEYSWNYDWTGALPATAPHLAEAPQPLRAPLVLATEAEAEDEPGLVQDFTTQEFAAGQW